MVRVLCWLCSLLFPLVLLSGSRAQSGGIPICYHIIHLEVEPGRTVVKIQVPPQLTTAQLMDQIRLVVQWPGASPPGKPVLVYVFPDTAGEGAISQIGAFYTPGEGYSWDLRDWQPIPWDTLPPSLQQKALYNAVVEAALRDTLHFGAPENHVFQKVALQFNRSVSTVRRAYFRVKHWLVWREWQAFRSRPNPLERSKKR